MGLKLKTAAASSFSRKLRSSLFSIIAILAVVDVDFYIGYPFLDEQIYAVLLGIALGWTFGVLGIVYAIFFPYLSEHPEIPIYFTVPFFLYLILQTHKHCGWAFAAILNVFLLYGLFKLTPEHIFAFLLIDNTAILGMPIAIMSGVVFCFILLGQIITQSKLADRLIDTVMTHVNSPARVAIISSGIFGSISGSAVSNVMSTGQITIPLMIQNGYSKVKAAAYEAVASTGGQLMPPVMGAAAFLMAEMLMISYWDVVLVAIIPTFIFYAILLITAPRTSKVSLPKRKTKLQFPNIINLLHRAGEITMPMVILAAAVGSIIGVLDHTGLSFRATAMMLEWTNGNIFAVLILTAIICIILGMGMPTSSAYLLVAVVAAPTLIEVGITPIYAHLFVLYYGVLSMITPPVALSSFTAAKIADADPIDVSFMSVWLALPLFIVPFIFVWL